MRNLIIFLQIAIFSVVYVKAKVIFDEALNEEWKAFKLKHGRKYRSPEEEAVRKVIFSENLFRVTEHNKLYDLDQTTYTMEVNKFSDLTEEEMEKYKGLKINGDAVQNIKKINFVPEVGTVVPDEFDWRDEGAVTEVKDQGSCGSCWAFSAIGALESHHFLKTGNLIPLSEQNIVDCSNQGRNYGCEGGIPVHAFDYVYLNGGIDTEESYPYTGKDGICRYNEQNNVSSIQFFGSMQEGEEDYLRAAVATIGPISVCIYADKSFKQYNTGVYYNGCCEENSPNHAVLVVGYGTTDNEVDYWLVKNSWGKDWGEEGYIRMARNKDNNCGIASEASFPVA